MVLLTLPHPHPPLPHPLQPHLAYSLLHPSPYTRGKETVKRGSGEDIEILLLRFPWITSDFFQDSPLTVNLCFGISTGNPLPLLSFPSSLKLLFSTLTKVVFLTLHLLSSVTRACSPVGSCTEPTCCFWVVSLTPSMLPGVRKLRIDFFKQMRLICKELGEKQKIQGGRGTRSNIPFP